MAFRSNMFCSPRCLISSALVVAKDRGAERRKSKTYRNSSKKRSESAVFGRVSTPKRVKTSRKIHEH